jgi:hypothetical protein
MNGVTEKCRAVIGTSKGKRRLVQLDVNGDNIKINANDTECGTQV